MISDLDDSKHQHDTHSIRTSSWYGENRDLKQLDLTLKTETFINEMLYYMTFQVSAAWAINDSSHFQLVCQNSKKES